MIRAAGGKREMSVRQALEWAFGVEHAQLDFDDLRPEGARPGRDTIATMMQRGALGCEIDGGGRSRQADDAETIANTLACLPVALGGRSMASDMAMWARAGMAPDWYIDLTPRCVPVAWAAENQHGRFAATKVIGQAEVPSRRGRKAIVDVRICPVTFEPTASQIGMAQRRYLGWCLALAHLKSVLQYVEPEQQTAKRQTDSVPLLSSIIITDAMPLQRPWAVSVRQSDKAA